jgi:hypothetical protein
MAFINGFGSLETSRVGEVQEIYGTREEGRESSPHATTDKVLLPALNLYHMYE